MIRNLRVLWRRLPEWRLRSVAEGAIVTRRNAWDYMRDLGYSEVHCRREGMRESLRKKCWKDRKILKAVAIMELEEKGKIILRNT